jgi:hypothetical protein
MVIVLVPHDVVVNVTVPVPLSLKVTVYVNGALPETVFGVGDTLDTFPVRVAVMVVLLALLIVTVNVP